MSSDRPEPLLPALRGSALAGHQPPRPRPHVPLPQVGWAGRRRLGTGADAAARPRRRQERGPADDAAALRPRRRGPGADRLQGRLPEEPGLVLQPAGQPGDLRAGRAGAAAGEGPGRRARRAATTLGPRRPLLAGIRGLPGADRPRDPDRRPRAGARARSPPPPKARRAAARRGGLPLSVATSRGRPGAGPVVAGAVDRDRRPGIEVAGRRGQVGEQPGDLLGTPGPPERDRLRHPLDDLRRVLGQQRLGRELAGGDRAGR